MFSKQQPQDSSLEHLLQSTRKASENWSALRFSQKRKYFLKLKELIFRDSEKIAQIICKENGKPLLEAYGHDVFPALELLQHFLSVTPNILREHSLSLGKWSLLGHHSKIVYEPHGVVGVISPWNFPFSIPMGQVILALMAGNGVILKPSEVLPQVNQCMRELFIEAGFPEDLIEIVEGDGSIGQALVNSSVDKIVFTGSVATGQSIMKACSESLKPHTLELGGKDPMVVFSSADLDMASSAAVWGAFCNSGQVCASVERVYVEKSIFEKFQALVLEKARQLEYGRDLTRMTLIEQVEKVQSHVDEAQSKGAEILSGGQSQGLYFEPTVLAGVHKDALILNEETFGPVLPLVPFQNEDEAIILANQSDYALNAYVWTKNQNQAQRVAKKIDAGTVNINDSVFTHALPQTPWGGNKMSGIGRTHGRVGLLDMVKIKHIHTQRFPMKKNVFWWFPYLPQKTLMMKSLATVLFGKGFQRVSAAFRYLSGLIRTKVN